MKQVIKS